MFNGQHVVLQRITNHFVNAVGPGGTVISNLHKENPETAREKFSKAFK